MIFFVCQYAIEMLNVSSTSTTKEQLKQLCNTTIDNSQDFTDSIYISIEQREKVLQYHQRFRDELEEMIKLISDVCRNLFLVIKNKYFIFRTRMMHLR
jgi:hypothetical protein